MVGCAYHKNNAEMGQGIMNRPTDRMRKTELQVANWVLQFVEEHEPLNLYDLGNAAYRMGFEDAERIAEQKDDEQANVPPVEFKPPKQRKGDK